MASRYWLDVSGDWNATANWSGAATVPVTGDTVYILAGSQNIATNLNQSAVTLASLIIGMGFTGTIGTSSAYLQISSTLCSIGVPAQSGQPTGSGRIKIDFGSVLTTTTVFATNNGTTDTNFEPVRLIGSNSGNLLRVLGGLVGVGTTLATETATISQADVDGGRLNYGFGVTWTTVNVAGQATLFSQTGGAASAVLTTAPNATATVNGTTKIVTVNAGGQTNLNMRPGSGDIVTTINLYSTGTIDFTGNPGTGTIGTLNHYASGTWNNSPASPNHVTATAWTRINGGTVVLS